MKATLLKRFDSLMGPLLVRLFCKPNAARPVVRPQTVLVIRPGGIGDAVLLVPTLRALLTAFPDCRIDTLGEKRNAAAFQLCPGLHNVYCYDSPSGLAAVLRGRYDVVIDTEQWYRLSAVIARLIRAARSIGFATNERARLFTDSVHYSLHEYEAASFLRLLAPLVVKPAAEVAVPFLTLPPAAVLAARHLLAPLEGKRFVALFPGASVPQKEWGIDNFRATTVALAAAGIAVVVVGGGDARQAGEAIAAGGIALNLAGKGSLMESAAVIGEASVLLSGDSGLLHIAAGLGTATVSLFGPSDPAKWAPKGDGHRVFKSAHPCAPCSRFGTIPPCSVAHKCLDANPAHVVDAVMGLWEGYGKD